MRISDWSSDVCASDLAADEHRIRARDNRELVIPARVQGDPQARRHLFLAYELLILYGGTALGHRLILQMQARNTGILEQTHRLGDVDRPAVTIVGVGDQRYRSEEHTSELQSLMRISYAVFCLKKKKKTSKLT